MLSQDTSRPLAEADFKMYQDDQDRYAILCYIMLSYAKAVEADSMELQMSQDEQPRQGTIRQAFS